MAHPEVRSGQRVARRAFSPDSNKWMLSVAVVSSPLQERHGQGLYRGEELLKRKLKKDVSGFIFLKLNIDKQNPEQSV